MFSKISTIMDYSLFYISITSIFSIFLVLPVFSRLFFKYSTTWCRSKKCLAGKTVIVTGANSGIGYETAKDFAMRGARVILACRNIDKAEKARREIIKQTDNDNVVVQIVDMSSFESVRKFAKEIYSTEKKLDILVNNAGLGSSEKFTKEGNVYLYQVNYYSHFLLTHLLLDLLKKSKPSRIVNVSSALAKQADFNVDKMDEYPGFTTDYNNSKLLQILFTKELAKKLEGSGVTVYSLHPGFVMTEFMGKVIWDSPTKRYLWNMFTIYSRKFSYLRNSEEGAQTTLYVALENGIEKYNGEHFDNCEKVDTYHNAKLDSSLIEKLWEKTEKIVGLSAIPTNGVGQK